MRELSDAEKAELQKKIAEQNQQKAEKRTGTKFASTERFELASLVQRLLGQFLDGLICIVGIVLIGLISVVIAGANVGLVLPVILIVFVLWSSFLYLLFQDGLKNGQSLGKRIVKTQVIDSRSGLPCTFWQSFRRNSPMGYFTIIDWLFIFGEKRQRLGDKAANTLVVKVKNE